MKARVLIGCIAFVAMSGVASNACRAEATWLMNYPERCEGCVDDGEAISCQACRERPGGVYYKPNPNSPTKQRLEYAKCAEPVIMNDDGKLVCVTKMANERFQLCMKEKMYKKDEPHLGSPHHQCKEWAGSMSRWRSW